MPHDELNAASYAVQFRQKKRLQIQNFLQPDVAERLFYCLENEVPWGIAYVDAESRPRIVTSDEVVNQSPKDWAALNDKVLKHASSHYQFLYNSYMMITAYKENRDPHLLLHRFVEYLNSELFITLVKEVTGADDIVKADAQATRYIPGCFLKKHNDMNQENTRRIAYVLNLTKDWQADWGGLLQFFDASGRVEETFFPSFNSLTLFEVPMWHAVSYVVPYASKPRYAITGWAMNR